MSTRTPGAQPRTQFHRDWGNYPSLSECPNASATVVPSLVVDGVLEVGDTASIGVVGRAFCVDVGTPGGFDAVWALTSTGPEYAGFQSSDLANYYRVPAADGGTCPGADDFVVVVLVAPFASRTAFNDMIAQIGVAVTRGWRIDWNGGNLVTTVFTGGPPAALQTVTSASTYAEAMSRGHMHALAMRVYQNGGNTVLEMWLGPALVATATGPATVSPASAADQMTLASGVAFGDERALNGGIYGFAYFEGTRTDDQMRSLLGRCLNERTIPAEAWAWNNAWLGSNVSSAPASWPATAGTVALERVGAPTGSAAYFPPV